MSVTGREPTPAGMTQSPRCSDSLGATRISRVEKVAAIRWASSITARCFMSAHYIEESLINDILLTKYGSLSSFEQGSNWDGSGMASYSSALSFRSTLGLLSTWNESTASVCAVGSPPPAMITKPSSASRSRHFSCSGRSLVSNSAKMVLVALSLLPLRASTPLTWALTSCTCQQTSGTVRERQLPRDIVAIEQPDSP